MPVKISGNPLYSSIKESFIVGLFSFLTIRKGGDNRQGEEKEYLTSGREVITGTGMKNDLLVFAKTGWIQELKISKHKKEGRKK